jgi:chitinase
MRLRYAAAISAAAVVLGAPAATADSVRPGGTAAHRPTSQAARFAPYLDLGAGAPGLLTTAIGHAHLRSFTAAFVLGRRCTPVWDDGSNTPVAADPGVERVITSAQRRGVTVVVSFGGAAPTELAVSCHSVAELTAAYRSVIHRFSVTHVDFDIEAAQLTDRASIVRRFHAIHALERGNRHLVVSLTVPSAVHGLRAQDDPHVLAVLRQARAEHVRVDLVNLMTMDYFDGRHHDMASAALTAVRAGRRQLRRVWPHAGYAQLGIIPMIGVNDDTTERFTLADARRVASFAKRHHVGRTAFWALGRDRECTRPQSVAADNCSGVAQRPLAFTRAMLR